MQTQYATQHDRNTAEQEQIQRNRPVVTRSRQPQALGAAQSLAAGAGVELIDLYQGMGAEFYDQAMGAVSGDAEVAAFVQTLRGHSGVVVDLGVGSGRLAIALAGTGFDVVGIDLSADMLAIAKQRLDQVPTRIRDRITLQQGDMRSFDAPPGTSVVTIAAGSISLLDRRDRRRFFERFVRLLPGTQLVLSVYEIDPGASGATSQTMLLTDETLGFVGTLTDSFCVETGCRDVLLIPAVHRHAVCHGRWFFSQVHMTTPEEIVSDATEAGMTVADQQSLHDQSGRGFGMLTLASPIGSS